MSEQPFDEKASPASIIVPFLAAAQFLTIAPPIIRRTFTPRELGASVAFYPLIGLLIGALLGSADFLLGQVFPQLVRSALMLAIWVLISGALHLDGFLDACDGLLGGHTAEQRLEIMRDERVGAFALAGGTLLLLVKFAALSELSMRPAGLLLAPTMSRWAMATAVVAFPYARTHGLGREIKDNARRSHAMIASLFTLLIAWGIAGWMGVAAFAASAVLLLGLAGFALQRLPGLTGDVYGALNEMAEVVILLVFTLGRL
jgi:adenosylcobinamide-GDP ribazoletransferase